MSPQPHVYFHNPFSFDSTLKSAMSQYKPHAYYQYYYVVTYFGMLEKNNYFIFISIRAVAQSTGSK